MDGPSLRLNVEKIKGAINDDVFQLVEISLLRNILVDGRFETVLVLDEYFRSSDHITHSDLMHKRVPDEDY